MSINLPTKEERLWSELGQVLHKHDTMLQFIVNAIQELQQVRALEVLSWALSMTPEEDKHVINSLMVRLIKAEKEVNNIEEFNTINDGVPV